MIDAIVALAGVLLAIGGAFVFGNRRSTKRAEQKQEARDAADYEKTGQRVRDAGNSVPDDGDDVGFLHDRAGRGRSDGPV